MAEKNDTNENIISFKFYHEKLLHLYEESFANGRIALENERIVCKDFLSKAEHSWESIKTSLPKVIEYDSGFCGLLAELTETKYRKVDFDYLFVELSRIIPFIDKLVGQLCDLNIGKGIVTESNTIKAMRRALTWLYVQSTTADEVDYADIERVKRFVRDKGIRLGKERSFEWIIAELKINNVGSEKDKDGFHTEKSVKKAWIKAYKKSTEILLRETFNCYDVVYQYFNLLKHADRQTFEKAIDRGELLTEDYRQILLLAESVLNVILRRFTAFAKINDINFPHGQFAYADLVSTDLSGSNFISSDFSNCDLSNAVICNSDISSCNLTKCDAENADLSRCKINSSDLVGSDFTNAVLSESQMSAVKFRNPQLDSAETYKKLKNFGEIEKIFKKSARSCIDWRLPSLSREYVQIFFENLSVEKQNFVSDNVYVTDEWKMTTCYYNDSRINFKRSMLKICERMEKRLREFFARQIYFIVPFALIRNEKRFISENTACFKSATMTGALMPDADLSYVDFSSANVSDADLSGSKLYYTNYTNAALSRANMSDSTNYGVSFIGAECVGTNLIGSLMLNCDLAGVNLKNALLINAVIINERYGEKKLEGYDPEKRMPYIYSIYDDKKPIYEAIDDTLFSENNSMCDANLDGGAASNSIISGMNLDRSSWHGAVLKKATIFNSLARWTSYRDADLSYAILIGVSFHQASLNGAKLSKARLYACDMSGVKLSQANMTGGRIEKVIFQNADLSEANFSRSVINNCLFNDVNFSRTNLSGAVFSNVIFENVDFSHCLGLASCRFYNCAFGSKCYKVEYQRDSRNRADKSFMSIVQDGARMKFFKEEGRADNIEENSDDSEVKSDRYTSLSYYLNK